MRIRSTSWPFLAAVPFMVCGSVVGAQVEPEQWYLAPDPEVVVGELGSDPAAELWRVRGFGIAADGSLVVLSAGHNTVKVFGPDGGLVRQIGRSGPGPGEMSFPYSLTLLTPDTVVVVGRDGLEVFTLDGAHHRSARLDGEPNAFGPGVTARPSQVLPDRSMLGVITVPGPSDQKGLFRPRQGMVVWPEPGADPVLLGWFGGIEQEYLEVGGRRQINVPPFARLTSFATGFDAIVVADNSNYRLEVFSTSGEPMGVIERPYEPVPVEAQWVEAWKEEQRANADPPSSIPGLERAWSEMSIPATLPPHQGVAIDSDGLLWVLRSAPPGVPRAYDVLDRTGERVASVEVPEGLLHGAGSPPWISGDRFVGVWRDALGVESVRVYELVRGPPHQ